MSVNPDVAGRSYPPAPPFQVGREAVRAFASAVQAQHPAHHDVEAARALGRVENPRFRPLLVPLMFDADLDVDPTATLIMQSTMGAMRLRLLGAELNGEPLDGGHIYDFCIRALAARLVLDPERFDVIVGSNLFGDHTSDMRHFS